MAAATTPCEHCGLAGFGQVNDGAADRNRLGSRRDPDDQILPARTLLVGPFPVATAIGPEVFGAERAQVAT